MRSSLSYATLIILALSPLIWMNGTEVRALSFNWTVNTLPTGEFVSCFAHLYGNEYWQSKGHNFAAVEVDNAGGDESESRSITVSLSGYSIPTTKNASLAPRERKTIYINPAFTTELKAVNMPTTATANLTIKRLDGTTSYSSSKNVTILPVDYLYLGKEGSLRPFSIIFSTPSTQPIRRLLNVANETTAFHSMPGYIGMEGFSQDVIVESQMRAVYNTLNALGITHADSKLAIYQTKAQKIKTTRQLLIDNSGNSLEIALLFVSAFEAVGFRPYLIFTSELVFVGIAEWTDSDRILPLDTTVIGAASYDDARSRGKDLLEAKKASDPTFLMVDVHELRTKHKVTSMPYIDTSSPVEFEEGITKVLDNIRVAKTAIANAEAKVDSIRDKSYDKSEAEALRQKAVEEYALAVALFDLGKYVEAKTHADQAVDYVSKAESTGAAPSGSYVILILIAAVSALSIGFALSVWRTRVKIVPEAAPAAPPAHVESAPPPATKTCVKCGASNVPTAKFCEACGQPFS